MRLGTRRSALARWQAEEVARRLRALGLECDLVPLDTSGDRRRDVPLAAIGGKGLYTQELEAGLLSGALDLAVHSLKDVPSLLPGGLTLAAMLERADPRDALVAAAGTTLATLPRKARVGTSSLRRQAQLLALRPDLEVLPLRGNVDTRLGRWRAGAFDAVLLAAAGLDRLGLAVDIAERLDPAQFLPSAGQGIIVIECRAGDAATLAAIAALNHAPTATAATAERAVLRRLDCGCQAPVAAHATLAGDALTLTALAASPDGTRVVREQASGLASDPAALGERVAEALLAAGAEPLLARQS
ncbi:MAG: hydroxymethylbilane synthase [Terriglobales bacterium]